MIKKKMDCPICGGEMVYFDTAEVLHKYSVEYFKCKGCGLICTEAPYWIDEAYSDAITTMDVFLVGRNIRYSKRIEALINVFFRKKEDFLDYGAGYGLLVRIMRNNGLNFEWYDKYCKNIFARYNEKTKGEYDVVTALEVFEHLAPPYSEIDEMFQLADNVVFSTSTIPPRIKMIKDWDYFAPEHGQHIIFYTRKSLKILAQKRNKYYVGTKRLHVISSKRIPYTAFILVLLGAPIVSRILRRKSLEQYDFEVARRYTYHE